MIDLKTLENKTLDECVEEMYKHPPGTHAFHMIQNTITDKLIDDKYEDYIIGFKSKLYGDDECPEDLNRIKFIKSIYSESIPFFYETHGHEMATSAAPDILFSNHYSFLEDNRFVIMQRKYFEYNPRFKQLVVAAYITDGTDIMLLRTNDSSDNRIQEKITLIQGHVDFDENAYIMSQEDFLLSNIKRELFEELQVKDAFRGEDMEFSIIPRYYINDMEDFIGLEHFGIIYEINVPSVMELSKMLESGEKDKHNIYCTRIEQLENINTKGKLDRWTGWLNTKLNK